MRVNVLDSPYSAIPDGLTDCTASIQAAIDDVSMVGGIVDVPAGNFRIANGPLQITVSNPAVTIQGEGYATLLQCGTIDKGILKITNGRHNVRDIILQGCHAPGCSSYVADIAGVEVLMDRVWIDGGNVGLYAKGADNDYRSLVISQTYGSDLILVTAGCWFHRGKFDAQWPMQQPAYGSNVLSAWQPNTGYGLGEMRVLNNYFIICSKAGTSGSSPFALPQYYVEANDGTAKWFLVCPRLCYGIRLDSNANETQFHNCDVTGARYFGVCATHAVSPSGNVPSDSQWHHSIISQTIGDCVYLDQGHRFDFRACRFGGTCVPGSALIRAAPTFSVGSNNPGRIKDCNFLGGAAVNIANGMTGGKQFIVGDNV